MAQRQHCPSCSSFGSRRGQPTGCFFAELNLGLGGWVGGAFVPTRTQNFHHFLKLALTKNPKKRPTAERLLQVGGRG